jgi:hypothetical protein
MDKKVDSEAYKKAQAAVTYLGGKKTLTLQESYEEVMNISITLGFRLQDAELDIIDLKKRISELEKRQ